MPRLNLLLLLLLAAAGGLVVPLRAAEPTPQAGWKYSQPRALRAVAFSPDGRWVATGGHDNVVRLLDAGTGKVARTLAGHTDRVNGLAFSPDGRLLASAGADRTIRLWNPETGAAVRSLAGHTDKVRHVAFSPDGRTLASTSEDRSVRLWDPATGRPGQVLAGHTAASWALAWSPSGDRLASGGSDHTIRLWNPATGAPAGVLQGHTDEVWALAFSPDGRTLFSGSLDSLVKAWDVASGMERRTYSEGTPVLGLAVSPDGSALAIASYTLDGRRLGSGTVRLRSARSGLSHSLLTGAQGTMMGLAFSPRGETLAGAGGYESADDNRPGEVLTWAVAALPQEMARLDRTPRLGVQSGHRGEAAAVAYSPDGTLIASGELRLPGPIKIWDARTGELLRTLQGQQVAIFSLAFSPDGSRLASGDGVGTVSLWDPRTGDLARRIPGSDAVRAVAFSPDGKWLAAANAAGVVRAWSAGTGAPLFQTPAGPERASLAYSPDGALLYTGSAAGRVDVLEAATGKTLRGFAAHGSPVLALRFTRDGKLLASAGQDGLVKLWDPAAGALVRALPPLKGEVRGLGFSPDGRRLATGSGSLAAGVSAGEIRLWDPNSGALLKTVATGTLTVPAVAFSPDGKELAAGTGNVWAGDVRLFTAEALEPRRTLSGPAPGLEAIRLSPDGRVLVTGSGSHESGALQVWDLARGELRQTLTGHTGQVTSLAFSRDGRRLVSGAWDGTARIWDTSREAGSWQTLKTLEGAFGLVQAVEFAPDGSTLLRAVTRPGVPGEVEIWDVEQGVKLRSLVAGPGLLQAAAFSPDGRLVAAGGEDRTLRLWETGTGKVVRTVPSAGGMLTALAFSPDGRTLAAGGFEPSSGGGQIQLLDPAANTPPRVLSGALLPRALAFSPDSSTLAGEAITVDEGRMVSELRLMDGQGVVRRRLTAVDAPVVDLSYSASGDRLATLGEDGVARVWLPAEGRLLASLVLLPDGGAALQGRPLLAGSKDAAATTEYLLFTPEGYYSGSAAADRYVRFRLGEDLFPAESFQARYYRPDLVRQGLAGAALPQVGQFRGAYPPVVAMTTPGAGVRVEGERLTVTMEASDDSSVERVELFVNGARVEARPLLAGSKPLVLGSKPLLAGSKPVPLQHSTSRTITASIPLPAGAREIRVQAIAYDEDGLQSPRDEILFTRDAAAAPTGRLLGLCVGVSRYADTGLNLKFAHKDAQSLAAELGRQRGVYRDAEVAALTDEKATSAGVREGLDRLVGQTTRQDTVVLFLSGHGWRREDRSFYFATHEVDRTKIPQTALSWADVVQRLRQLSEKSKRVLVLLDACHSGSAASNEDLVKAVLSANAGVLIFASSKGSELSLESPELEQGLFTRAVLEALEGKAVPPGEKGATLLDFLSYVSRRVKSLSSDMQHPHVPFLQDFDTDSTLVTLPG